MPGNIIANQGFINQFGSVLKWIQRKSTRSLAHVNCWSDMIGRTGALALSAHDVSVWGGGTSAGQIAGMILQAFVGDKLGRKASLLTMSLFLALVSNYTSIQPGFSPDAKDSRLQFARSSPKIGRFG